MRYTFLAAPMAFLVASTALFATHSTPSSKHGARQPTSQTQTQRHETVTPIFEHELPNVPGKSLLAVEVVYPPGVATPPHRHPRSAFIYAYVVSGEIVSAVDNEPPRVYHAGESWSELPGADHRVSRNASKTKPAKLLAVFVKDVGKGQLVFPDPK